MHLEWYFVIQNCLLMTQKMALFEFLFVIQNSMQSFEWHNIGQNAVFVVKNVNFAISLTAYLFFL